MLIERPYYLDKLIRFEKSKLIKVITGARRVGKSTLIFDLYNDHLIKMGISSNQIIKIRLDLKEFDSLRDSTHLYEYIKSRIIDSVDNYIFIDEVQLCSGFEDVLNSFIARGNCYLYVTGSNSKLLSKEINTKLRGRTIEIKVYPLSFDEFCSYSKNLQEDNWKKYAKYGGLPELLFLNDDKSKEEYLSSYINDIIEKDIIERYNLRSDNYYKKVIFFLASSIGSLISANKIKNTFSSSGLNNSTSDSISNYLTYSCESNIFLEAKRWDIKGKRYISFNPKYYCFDLGVRNKLIEYRQIDSSHVLENIIYLELIRRYGSVDVGINSHKEVDFIVRDSDDTYYIQVVSTINTPEKLNTELKSFDGIVDSYKKIIITKDEVFNKFIIDKFKVINIFDFLLNKEALATL
ncbi:MAG: ATP-binding protein [Acholeplasmatales bacterium]|jgi:predicted AAA+ superfamily ATPase|nr:ATP-binding protein [Acholeplasmatales bacterium]